MAELEFHPVANIFPMMDEAAYQELKADIAKYGQREAVWVFESKIIDGRNRYKACKELGKEPALRFWSCLGGASVTAFVCSLNLHRRHLTASQKAAVAAECLPLFEAEAKERMETGRPKKGTENFPRVTGEACEKAAAAVHVNPRYVRDAKKIKEKSPALHEQVKAGTVTLQAAKSQIAPPKPKPPKDNVLESLERFKKLWQSLGEAERRLIRAWILEDKKDGK